MRLRKENRDHRARNQSEQKVDDRSDGRDTQFTLGIGIRLRRILHYGYTADGQQQDGAQAQPQPRSNQQAGSLAHGNGRHQQDEESQSARQALRAAHGKEHQHQEREEDVDAKLHAHPPAKRNRPTAHSSIVEGRGERQLPAISF